MTFDPTIFPPKSRWLSLRVRKMLSHVSIWWYEGKSLGKPDYPQTCLLWSGVWERVIWGSWEPRSFGWYANSFVFRKLYKPPLFFLCRFFTGHELSRTEKGYGGGITEDRHCRWCDKVFQVPAGEFAKKWGGDIKGSLCGF